MYQGFPQNRVQTGCLLIFIGFIALNSTPSFDVYQINSKSNHPVSGVLGETMYYIEQLYSPPEMRIPPLI
jgi:hypothetical protein